jgi:hypothetical protein
MEAHRRAAAFLSYAHADDVDDQITQFAKRLRAELRVQLGYELPVFQDRTHIGWGQAWRQRIEDSVDAATFLIPVLTPSFFASDECLKETRRFLDREAALKRNDLVLPIYYVEHPPLTSPGDDDADTLLAAIGSRQHIDWRDLRFEPPDSPEIRRAHAQLAVAVRDALARPTPPESGPTATSQSESRGSRAPSRGRRSEGGEPPTHVVDAMGRGDFRTIKEALTAAQPGDRVIVRPGLYRESLTISTPIEILGEGPRAEIVLQSSSSDPVVFTASMGRIANMTLRKATNEGEYFGVDVVAGRLELDDCDVSSDCLAGVAVRGDADARIRRCHVHDTPQGGVYFYGSATGVVEDCEIYRTAFAGVEVSEETRCTVRANVIHDCAQSGVYVRDTGQAVIEGNEMRDLASGVDVQDSARAEIRGNRISRLNRGVLFAAGTGGVLSDNQISEVGRLPISIADGATVQLGSNDLPPAEEPSAEADEAGSST